MEDKAKLEASGTTIPITLKEEIEAFEKDEHEATSADMLSLDPPLPPPRRRQHRTPAPLPDIPKTADHTVGIVGGAEATTNVSGVSDVVLEHGNVAQTQEKVEGAGDETRATECVSSNEVANFAEKVQGRSQDGEWGKSRQACITLLHFQTRICS